MPLFNLVIDETVDQIPQIKFVVDQQDSDPILPSLPNPSTPPQTYPTMASVTNISKRPKSWAFRAAMMESFMNVELITLPALDVVATEMPQLHQIPTPDYYKDHLSDEGTEKITLPLIDYTEETSLQQVPNPEYSKDHLSDEGVEKITLAPAITRMFAYDTDAEQQIQNPYWSIDVEEEREGVPYVILPPNIWDNDVENQILGFLWNVDYQGWEYNDTFRQIVPLIPPILIFHTLLFAPRLIIHKKINASSQVLVQSVTNSNRLAIANIYVELAG